MNTNPFIALFKSPRKSRLAVLIDPDKYNPDLVKLCDKSAVSCILLGGSRLEHGNVHATALKIKKLTRKPIVLFPGDENQLTGAADGVLLPLLLSGRNADYLGGKQVLMAPRIKKFQLPVTPLGYLLIDGGRESATQQVTGTHPMNPQHLQLIADTALACQYMGCKAVYLEAGSGASHTVHARIIRKVKHLLEVPLIAGGGVDSAKKAQALVNAGADLVVVGNALEKDVTLLESLNPIFKSRSWN